MINDIKFCNQSFKDDNSTKRELTFKLILKNELELIKNEKLDIEILAYDYPKIFNVKIYPGWTIIKDALIKIFNTYINLKFSSILTYSFELIHYRVGILFLDIKNLHSGDEFEMIKFLMKNCLPLDENRNSRITRRFFVDDTNIIRWS